MKRFLPKFWRTSEQADPSDAIEACGSIQPFHDLRVTCEREFRRARRYERPLSVLVLTLEATPASEYGDSGTITSDSYDDAVDHRPVGAHHQAFVQVGTMLGDALRETDILGHIADTREFVVLLPETGAAEAERTALRIQDVFEAQINGVLSYAAVTYPAGGLTLDQLIQNALLLSRARRGRTPPRLSMREAPVR